MGSNEVSKSKKNISENVSLSSATSIKAMGEAEKGRNLSQSATRSIEDMRRTSYELQQMVLSLNEKMENIGRVVNMIQSIADQTNLLALNAAI